MIRPPSAPGAASPASAQARSRAAARAARIAASARGPSAARELTSRDTTGSDATDPASSGCSRSTAMSARQSPPSASAAARSATILPGHAPPAAPATGQDLPTAPGPARSPASSPTAAPPRPGTPGPGRQQTRPPGYCVRYSSSEKCLRLGRTGPLTSPILPGQGTFSLQIVSVANSRRKPEANQWAHRSRRSSSIPAGSHRSAQEQHILRSTELQRCQAPELPGHIVAETLKRKFGVL